MEEKIKEAAKEYLLKEGLFISSVRLGEEEGVKTLFIELDSEEVIDLEKIVKATEILNPIIDELDLIKEEYTLDVSSKEKGEN